MQEIKTHDENEAILKILKLVTGEMVIGEVFQREDGSYNMSLPALMTLNPESGSIGLMPFDFVYTMNFLPEIDFKENHVVVIHEYPPREIIEAYFDYLDDTVKRLEEYESVEEQLKRKAAEIEAADASEK